MLQWTGRLWRHAPRLTSGGVSSSLQRVATDDSLFLRKFWRSTRGRWQRLALGAFALWALYSLALSPNGWLQLMRTRKEVEALESEVRTLKMRTSSLDRMGAEMQANERFQMEKRAREDFGYARENERIYVLQRDAEDERCLTEGELRGGDRFSDRPASVR